MDRNPFLKRLIKAEKEDIFHSSAYAQAQNGMSMGSASTQSFADRMAMEKNRTRVRGYSDSRIASGAMSAGPRPKTYTPPAPGGGGARPAGPRPMPKNPGISR